MNNILLFEYFNPNLELKNDLTNHLSQFPYLVYTLKDDNKDVIIAFNKEIGTNYGLGLLDVFDKEVLDKFPLKVKVTGMKNIDKFQEFQGKTIIQNIEKVDFPQLKISGVEAKVDTGATCSSLGVSKMTINRKTKKVSFVPLSDSFEQYTGKTITLPIHSEIKVQSSNGDEQVRPLIKTDIVIKGKTYETFISLADRDKLDFAVLLGKDILSGKFLVQPGI
jgi:hypothetical protein